ncbi:hypothetical protein G159_19145 [Planococcus glaciei CHR43]|uniref:hypothetical protein n=1 Tax=Planococcus glaciei TaxID=459472 RepID=UPI0003DEF6F9|nr:hypothetical protein [Planococcus glaciei]ETP67264.1 hypothetical protein G159_19145 [Planococcus glaciei CHR43]
MNAKLLCLSLIVFIFLFGCSQGKETIGDESSNPKEDLNATSQKPPSLTVAIHEEEIAAALGAYTWSYYDQEAGGMVAIEAESLPPSELAGSRKAPAVNSDTSIELNFEEEPISYKVNIWDAADKLKGSFKEVQLNGRSGRTIYEVVATWKRGTGHYVFPLNVE